MSCRDGVIVVDKPGGMTSFQVVREVGRIWNTRRAGHCGTLDPMATGVLPVCVGEATKIAGFLRSIGISVEFASAIDGFQNGIAIVRGHLVVDVDTCRISSLLHEAVI